MASYYINELAQGKSLDITEIWEAVEEAKQKMGAEALLDALTLIMDRDELESDLSYIISSNNLADPEEKEEEDL